MISEGAGALRVAVVARSERQRRYFAELLEPNGLQVVSDELLRTCSPERLDRSVADVVLVDLEEENESGAADLDIDALIDCAPLPMLFNDGDSTKRHPPKTIAGRAWGRRLADKLGALVQTASVASAVSAARQVADHSNKVDLKAELGFDLDCELDADAEATQFGCAAATPADETTRSGPGDLAATAPQQENDTHAVADEILSEDADLDASWSLDEDLLVSDLTGEAADLPIAESGRTNFSFGDSPDGPSAEEGAVSFETLDPSDLFCEERPDDSGPSEDEFSFDEVPTLSEDSALECDASLWEFALSSEAASIVDIAAVESGTSYDPSAQGDYPDFEAMSLLEIESPTAAERDLRRECAADGMPAPSTEFGDPAAGSFGDLPGLDEDADFADEFTPDLVPMLSDALEDLGPQAVDFETDPCVSAPSAGAGGSFAHPVWVLGASIGGPQAVKEFVAQLPPGTPACFVIAQHIGVGFVDLLAEQLGRVTALEVRAASSGLALGPGQIVVAPVDERMVFSDGVITLEPSRRKSVYSPSIDEVMTDVAHAFGAKAHAILFSGMGSDGVEGARAIVAAGGSVWCQEASTCVISSMADTARQAGVVSRSGTPVELAQSLLASLNGESENE